MLTEAEISRMRMTAEAILPDRGQIQRRTLTPDGYGNQTETWNALAWVNCRIHRDDAKMPEREQAGVITAIGDFDLTVPWNAAIEAKDRIVINGTTYEIVEPVTDTSWRITRQLRAQKVG